LPISQYTALFSLLGTNYGGNGTSTFQLPNFQGNAAVSQGQGPGLSPYSVGETAGVTDVTLLYNNMPTHNHLLMGTGTEGTQVAPSGNQLAKAFTGSKTEGGNTGNYLSTAAANATLNPNSIGPNGGNVPHNNMQPYLTVNFCIAMRGQFPARN
jgi:microcystin-dependent protein